MTIIVSRVIRANECDTLLSIAEEQLILKDSAVITLNKSLLAKDIAIVQKDDIILLKEDIIIGKDNEITELREALKKKQRGVKWLKVGLASSLAALIYTIFR